MDTVEITFFDTESGDECRGELVNPYRIREDLGVSVLAREVDEVTNLIVLIVTPDKELHFHLVEPQNISAVRHVCV